MVNHSETLLDDGGRSLKGWRPPSFLPRGKIERR